jgi:hypothetical protein
MISSSSLFVQTPTKNKSVKLLAEHLESQVRAERPTGLFTNLEMHQVLYPPFENRNITFENYADGQSTKTKIGVY